MYPTDLDSKYQNDEVQFRDNDWASDQTSMAYAKAFYCVFLLGYYTGA